MEKEKSSIKYAVIVTILITVWGIVLYSSVSNNSTKTDEIAKDVSYIREYVGEKRSEEFTRENPELDAQIDTLIEKYLEEE
jgi:hypothetical protein